MTVVTDRELEMYRMRTYPIGRLRAIHLRLTERDLPASHERSLLSGYDYNPPEQRTRLRRRYRHYATDSGVVIYAGWSDRGCSNTIVIDHGNGYLSYAHLMDGASRLAAARGLRRERSAIWVPQVINRLPCTLNCATTAAVPTISGCDNIKK